MSNTKQAQSRVPKLRFRGFEDEWNKLVMGDIFKGVKDPVGQRDIETYSISAGLGFVSQQEKFGRNISGDQNAKYTVLKPAQFTYNKGNSKTYKYGCIYLNDLGKTIAVPNVFISFELKDKNFIENYFAKLFESHYLDRGLRRIISSSARMDGLLNVNKNSFFKLPITHPNVAEQQKIADCLIAVDNWIENLQQQKEKLEAYKKGVMQKIFSQEIRFKDENGNSFPEWRKRILGGICVINPSTSELPQKFIYIDLGSVKDGILKEEITVSADKAPSRAQRKLENNDILFQTVRPYQKNNLLFNRGLGYVASTGYAQLRTNENPAFIFQLLLTDNFLKKVLRRCTGTGYPTINSSDLKKIKIFIPHFDEQERISDFLSTINSQIEAKQFEIEKAEQWKKGLMQQIFV